MSLIYLLINMERMLLVQIFKDFPQKDFGEQF